MRDYPRSLVTDQGTSRVREDVSEGTGAERRERRIAGAIENIRKSSPEFSNKNNVFRDALYGARRSLIVGKVAEYAQP